MKKNNRCKKTYVLPSIEVIHMEEHCGLCNFTTPKQEKYGYQDEKNGGGHNGSSFEEDYGDLFGTGGSAKALGAQPVGESTYESLEHNLD